MQQYADCLTNGDEIRNLHDHGTFRLVEHG